MRLGTIETLPLERIRPYAGNPRVITEQAVESVAASIEKYGYRQPIVVDRDGVIIVGHTRYEAMKRLGWTEAEVLRADLPEEKAREYRLVDNRTSEMTFWEHDALVAELREMEQGMLDRFFPDVSLEIESVSEATAITEEDVQEAIRATETVRETARTNTHTTEVVCPSCFHTFDVITKTLPVSSNDLIGLAGRL